MADKINTLDDLLLHLLRDIYYAENQITKALPKMASNAGEPALRSAFEEHLEQTREQIDRLDQVFKQLGVEAKGVECQAIDGIIEEANETMGEITDQSVRDVALLASAQAVEHYEITRYGTIIALAEELGHEEIIDLLEETLDEEKETDEKLTEIAASRVNQQAAAA